MTGATAAPSSLGSCGWGVGEPRPETAFGAVRVAAGAGISVVCAKDVGIAKEEVEGEEEREVRVTVEGSDGLAGFEGFGGGRRWVASSRAEADQLVKVDDGAGVPVEEATEGDPAVVVAAATGEGAGIIIIIVVLADGG